MSVGSIDPTRAVFADHVNIYDIQDAVDDGATVPMYCDRSSSPPTRR